MSGRPIKRTLREGQSAVMAGALSLDRSAGGVCGVMRPRSFCGVQRGERGC